MRNEFNPPDPPSASSAACTPPPALTRLNMLHRSIGNVRSLLERKRVTRTPDDDAQARMLGDWQEQVYLAIGELTESAACTPPSGTRPLTQPQRWQIGCPAVIPTLPHRDDCSWCHGTRLVVVYFAADVDAHLATLQAERDSLIAANSKQFAELQYAEAQVAALPCTPPEPQPLTLEQWRALSEEAKYEVYRKASAAPPEPQTEMK
jgi:hypothetical protein